MKLVSELKELESRSSSNSDCVSAEEWTNHFSKLLYDKNMENCLELEPFFCNMPTAKTLTNLDYRIIKDEVKTCISKLKSGKAVGMDRISAEMIKTSVDQLLPVYEKLFNSIFRKNIYPHNWKEIFLVPLFKSGVTVYLTPLDRGGGKLSRVILPPPHPGYLHPRGGKLSRPVYLAPHPYRGKNLI